MTDFENQKKVTPKPTLHTDTTTLYDTQQVPTINGVPVLTLFEKVIRKNHKKMTRHTPQRPSYLQYIDY